MEQRTVELRKVKIARFMSEETTAFTAELWVDGNLLGHVKNDGRGGNNQLDPAQWTPEGHAQIREFEAWCRNQPAEEFDGKSLSMNCDFFLGLLLEQYEENAMLKRKCKRNVMIKLVGQEEGRYSEYKGRTYAPEIAASIREHFGDKLVEIINERFL
jgi:hypothetical protein